MHNAMRAAREKAGYTKYRLAKETGVCVSSIMNWEAGRTGPSVTAAVLVCDALGISLDEYIGRKKHDG